MYVHTEAESSVCPLKGTVQQDGWGYKSGINRKLSFKGITAEELTFFQLTLIDEKRLKQMSQNYVLPHILL